MAKSLKNLKLILYYPGVSFYQARDADIKFQNVGFTPEQSRQMIILLGNEMESFGYGERHFEKAVENICYLSVSERSTALIFISLVDVIPRLKKYLIDAFGTCDPKQLTNKGITGRETVEALFLEMEKSPRITEGSITNCSKNVTNLFILCATEMETSMKELISKLRRFLPKKRW